MHTPQNLLIGDQKKVALIFEITNMSGKALEDFELKVSLIEQQTNLPQINRSRIRYYNTKEEQQTLSDCFTKKLSEFINLIALASHEPINFKIDFELLPTTETNNLNVNFKLFDTTGKLMKDITAEWKKDEGTVSNLSLSQEQPWKDILEKYSCDQVIQEQYNKFINHQSPTIAAEEIKIVPIEENQEILVDIRKEKHPRISMMDTPPKPFEGPNYNAGCPHSSKIRASVFNAIKNAVEELDKLAPAFGYEPKQIEIKLFEGLRDLQTQQMIFDYTANQIRTKNPTWGNDQIEKETEKWVSPVKNNIPVHATGGAIDIRLWDKHSSSFLDMGPFGVFTPNPTAPTFSEEIAYKQKLNRLFLLLAATKSGLINYSYEYWHFSYGDRYAAYWLEKVPSKRVAIYGAVENLS
jgi:D-alanyl-D-alanine dipeptidase